MILDSISMDVCAGVKEDYSCFTFLPETNLKKWFQMPRLKTLFQLSNINNADDLQGSAQSRWGRQWTADNMGQPCITNKLNMESQHLTILENTEGFTLWIAKLCAAATCVQLQCKYLVQGASTTVKCLNRYICHRTWWTVQTPCTELWGILMFNTNTH